MDDEQQDLKIGATTVHLATLAGRKADATMAVLRGDKSEVKRMVSAIAIDELAIPLGVLVGMARASFSAIPSLVLACIQKGCTQGAAVK